MEIDEIEEFLSNQQTGVLALAANNDAYGIPVLFVYHGPDHNEIYFRFGYGGENRKRGFLDTVETANLVVYDNTEQGWYSVIARGPVTELTESSIDAQIVQYLNNLRIPYFRVFTKPEDSMEFSIVRLDMTELTGVKAAR